LKPNNYLFISIKKRLIFSEKVNKSSKPSARQSSSSKPLSNSFKNREREIQPKGIQSRTNQADTLPTPKATQTANPMQTLEAIVVEAPPESPTPEAIQMPASPKSQERIGKGIGEIRRRSVKRAAEGRRRVESSRKRQKPAAGLESSIDEQTSAIAQCLHHLEGEFKERERSSASREWCAPVPQSRMVDTVYDFYSAFHCAETLPIHTCMICYRKFCRQELDEISWSEWQDSKIYKESGNREGSPFSCDDALQHLPAPTIKCRGARSRRWCSSCEGPGR
jgi:hypothetical protein